MPTLRGPEVEGEQCHGPGLRGEEEEERRHLRSSATQTLKLEGMETWTSRYYRVRITTTAVAKTLCRELLARWRRPDHCCTAELACMSCRAGREETISMETFVGE